MLPRLQAHRIDALMEPLVIPGGAQWMDFCVRGRDEGDQFALYMTHNSNRYDAAGVVRVLEDLVELITSLVVRSDRQVSDVAA